MEIETIECPDGHYERCRWLVEHAKKHKNIVDIGCNDGFMFRDLDLNVTETDIQYSFPPEYKNKIKFVEADAHDLPFEDNEFDCAILGDMLEHVKDPVQVIKEACRVSTHTYISVPNEWEWDETKRPFQFAPHIRYYTVTSLIDDLKKASVYDKVNICKIRGGGWSFFCVDHDKYK
jgi:ubiquinone/menaquinone biosynthesis C-methylase UbiE